MPAAVTKFPNLRVLAVEDYMSNVELLEAMLLDLACDFEVVDNHNDALELHSHNPFDVILFDILVPDIDGAEAINSIRKLPGRASETHIIVASKLVPSEWRKWSTLGRIDRVAKPIKIRDLEETFLRVAPHKALRRV